MALGCCREILWIVSLNVSGVLCCLQAIANYLSFFRWKHGRVWEPFGCTPLIIYREQILSLFSWIWIKGYMENFRKELCSLEVCCVWCQPLSLSKTLLEAGFKDLIFSSQSKILLFSLIVFAFPTAVLAAESHLFGNFGGKCFVPVKIGKLEREIEVQAGPLVLHHQEQQL